jgi:hypothetical protein
LLEVQGWDKLEVIDSSCKCIVNSLYLNRPTQQHCSEKMKVFVKDFCIYKNMLSFDKSGASPIKFWLCASHKQKHKTNSNCQPETKLAKRLLTGTKSTYNEIEKKENFLLAGSTGIVCVLPGGTVVTQPNKFLHPSICKVQERFTE